MRWRDRAACILINAALYLVLLFVVFAAHMPPP